MKEPKRIKLTDSPESKRVNLTPLPSKNNLEYMEDEIEIELTQKKQNENNTQNNPQSIQQLESEPTD